MAARNERVFLIGYRCTGKSSAAQILATRLGWNWLDADDVLERHWGRSIAQIFAEDGEAAFRDKEEAILAELCRMRDYVIATGGGVILRESNRARLKQAGTVVWLTADADTIWCRLQADATTALRRPALTVGGKAEIVELLRRRTPLYAECADLAIDTARRNVAQVAEMAEARLRLLLDQTT